MTSVDVRDFEKLLLNSTPWIDVRAPIEFLEGSIPGAMNLPLMNDDERRQVGICYKQNGREAAIALGNALVSGEVQEQRIQNWLNALGKHPEAIIYCFRGGLRSQITQKWLRERGTDRPLVAGGYKALRQYLLKTIEELSHSLHFEVVSGLTGSGKTHFLHSCGEPFIDLEELARHRGSAFGEMAGGQPSQVNFENGLAVALLRLKTTRGRILIESESRMIGKRVVPETLFHRIKDGPKIILEVPFKQRVENIFQDYIQNSVLGQNGDVTQFTKFRNSVMAISQKLGGLRTQEIMKDLSFSEAEFLAGRGLESNRVWIEKLLRWYYDPIYLKQRTSIQQPT